MAINFPDVSGLSNGYTQTIGDTLYTLNKTSNTVFYWSASLADNPDNRYLNKSGDTCTGSLQIQGNTSINVTESLLATDANGNIIPSLGQNGNVSAAINFDTTTNIAGSGFNIGAHTDRGAGADRWTFETPMNSIAYNVMVCCSSPGNVNGAGMVINANCENTGAFSPPTTTYFDTFQWHQNNEIGQGTQYVGIIVVES